MAITSMYSYNRAQIRIIIIMYHQGSNNMGSPLFRPRPGRLLDQVSEVMRYYHYSKRTEESYVKWIMKFILFHNKRHPSEMGNQLDSLSLLKS